MTKNMKNKINIKKKVFLIFLKIKKLFKKNKIWIIKNIYLIINFKNKFFNKLYKNKN